VIIKGGVSDHLKIVGRSVHDRGGVSKRIAQPHNINAWCIDKVDQAF